MAGSTLKAKTGRAPSARVHNATDSPTETKELHRAPSSAQALDARAERVEPREDERAPDGQN